MTKFSEIKSIFFTKHNLVILSSIICFIFVLVAYWPSFSVPFYFDDTVSIAQNQLLKTGSIQELLSAYGMRFFGYLTFWINIQSTGLSLYAFHVTNFIIHIANGIVLFYLCLLLLKEYQTNTTSKYKLLVSISITMVWLLHPLNTQAVTYVVQRLASLTTFFYLLALYSYFKLRFELFSKTWCIGLLLSILFGLMTKQNFVVFFVCIYYFELIYSSIRIRNWILILTAVAVVSVIILDYILPASIIEALNQSTKEVQEYSRYDYFVTQLLVVLEYIKKFFIPVKQQLFMANVLTTEISFQHVLALSVHFFLLFIAITLRNVLPIFTIGVVVFYTGHSVESFVIPIRDIAFEHRTYLPNIGLTILCVSVLAKILEHKPRFSIFALISICLTFTTMTYHRNKLWQEPFNFYENEYRLSPQNPRAMEQFAVELTTIGKSEAAEVLLRDAINISVSSGKLSASSLNNLIVILTKRRDLNGVVEVANIALRHITNRHDRSMIMASTSYAYISMGYCEFAHALSQSALELDPTNIDAKRYIEECSGRVSHN